MSEAGKVSLPTPERSRRDKEENFKVGSPWWFTIEKADIAYLFHLLEESQIKELQEGNRSACESRDMAFRSRDEAIVISNQHYKQAFFLNEVLIEAQQTIARHETALNEIIAYSTDENTVDIAGVSMGYVEGEKTDGM
ncbi:hypothetical protein [Paenibacillus pseudetheri]|uniref:Uncharacterized protein n=1 Tax=Paenibacillus pseudetheri TaxID=2897682 RepID=A0ABM9BBT4_9BACL|nr:hypothetical protein [Paenibacillus pseudetheri]CAH1055951.1 hypothetical protein PAECIP111894_02104 [Paenibacillus pseudetheri]